MNACKHMCKNLLVITRTSSTSKSFSFPLVLAKRNYREIEAYEEGKTTTIKGFTVEDEGGVMARRLDPDDMCPLRSRGLKITPEDVLILRQFISSSGDVLTRDETGLSQREYYKVISCVKMAQRANWLPGPENNTSVTANGTRLNTYLTRYPIGTRSPIRGRGLWYRKSYYRVGDARVARDSPNISRGRVHDKH